MKKGILILMFILMTAISLSSCREKSDGEKIEDGVEEVGEDLEEGAEEVGDEIDDATDDNN